ncbi:MAG: hypothetical protein K5912_01675 [Alphaproteobacteria bacterium]|nr:hypothetical protein [Alphaproteobacteria bacterium]
MKRKIVYISGSEVFDINDVRDAFDEVRAALNLDSDTVLFGVPVDNEQNAADAGKVEVVSEDVFEPIVEEDELCPGCQNEVCDCVEITEEEPECVTESPVAQEEIAKENESIEPEASVNPKNDSKDTVVPILSVLAAKPSEDQDIAEPVKDREDSTDSVNITVKTTTHTVTTVNTENMSEMINDDMPVQETEKTLEELLESMTPLQEDVQSEPAKSEDVNATPQQASEIDITLESLASEFAENQDKIVPQKKASERGKIGKLKNILPFKKLKRDDSGIMGDLFGWAGAAANDDDFSVPGFFSNAK